METGDRAAAAWTSSWEMSSFRMLAITSRKRPVPAAHLSFMMKFSIIPLSLREITLASCPPMSMMVRTSGKTQWAPRAWQLSSLTDTASPPECLRP